MNVADTELIQGILNDFHQVDKPELAEVILLNTCSVRENAVNKIVNRIAQLKRVSTPPPRIGILGCMAANLKEILLSKQKADFVIGPDGYSNLPEIISRLHKHINVTFSNELLYEEFVPKRQSKPNAWVTIIRGCNNFCSYCVVPYTRGREKSRPAQQIISEIRQLSESGFPQVTLLGQNVNSYHFENYNFCRLIEEIANIPTIKRIRFMSPHPKDFSTELLNIIHASPKICKHIHLPLQSGNTRILKKMNRGYTQKEYLKLVDDIKSLDIAVTTDIIIGFPSETEDEFQDTVQVMKYAQFNHAYIFKYSPRIGTYAQQHYSDDCNDIIKTKRITLLNTIQKEISISQNQRLIGKTVEVLIESVGTKKDEFGFEGRTDQNQLVILSGKSFQIGDLKTVKIIDASAHVLKGEPI